MNQSMKSLLISGYPTAGHSHDGSKNTGKMGIMSLKGNVDDMPKKEKTLKELQAECEALSKQNFDLRKQNLILTIQNEYLKKFAIFL